MLHLNANPGQGLTFTDVEFALTANDRVRPDVLLLTRERALSVLDLTKVPVPGAPDLAVEIISPSERSSDTQLKLQAYLRHGTEEVWAGLSQIKVHRGASRWDQRHSSTWRPPRHILASRLPPGDPDALRGAALRALASFKPRPSWYPPRMNIASRGILAYLVCTLTITAGQRRPVAVDDLGTKPLTNPVSPVWSPDEHQFAYIDHGNLFVFDIRSQTRRELLPMKQLEEAAAKAPEPDLFDWTNRRVTEAPLQWFSSNDRLLVSAGGDLFLVPLKSAMKPFEQLTNTALPEYDPKLSPDDRYVSFRRQHDLYVLEVATKTLTRLTENGSETLLNAQLDWVYPEELDLGTAHWWSPDSKHIAYLQLDTHAEPIFPQVSLPCSRWQAGAGAFS